ncbi:histidine kinase [Gordoniibacillus kamchatkensis]|uniref:histidine kinase n=1 Tax=Gordoniibacillus kamchatkensis TaxID=1590651 RepID=A0ABR5ALF9_9BACL|nr:HAMP domain-containing sensor histidine kinase [Paenibacillus sp. VKM B-2647]KIL41628.1 histidine kinase [Paenibacillus sp. VKM B-2647]
MHIIKDTLLQLFFALLPFLAFNVFYRDKTQNYSRKFIVVTCATSLFVSMTFASSVKHGIIFDIRYIIMYFGIVFGGVKTGVILLVEFVLYRFWLGGEGRWVAMIIMVCTFPLSILFNRLYQRTHRVTFITFLAGIVFSIIPFVFTYSFFDSAYFVSNIGFHVLALPVQNSLGIWLLISLFNQAVLDKELSLSYAQIEKVWVMSHVAASLVHEVRNPLTVVKGFLTLIRENALSKDKIEKYIDISFDEMQRTESILSEYLSLSKPLIERRERIDLAHHLQTVLDVMSPYANMSNVRLDMQRPPEPLWIFANADEIKQMLVNFIKNAVEACSETAGGMVSIRLNTAAKHAAIAIKDNGVGMSQEQMSRLGAIYFSTKSSGTGLGLTFSYRVIRALGGSVSVRSEPKAGTEFLIKLPLMKAKADSSAT